MTQLDNFFHGSFENYKVKENYVVSNPGKLNSAE